MGDTSIFLSSFLCYFCSRIKAFRKFFDKIINPQKVLFDCGYDITSVSFGFDETLMFSYNRYIGKVINSSVNRAAALDSLNDVFATSGVILGTFIGSFTNFC